MADRITVEQLVRVRIPSHELLIELTPEEAKDLADGIHAELTPKAPSYWDCEPTDEGLDRLAADLGVTTPVAETGPPLQDDIEAMIANHSVGADEKVEDPSLKLPPVSDVPITIKYP